MARALLAFQGSRIRVLDRQDYHFLRSARMRDPRCHAADWLLLHTPWRPAAVIQHRQRTGAQASIFGERFLLVPVTDPTLERPKSRRDFLDNRQ